MELKDLYYSMNPWWTGDIHETGIDRLNYKELIKDSYKARNIEILVGGRRTGKTTILKQIISVMKGKVDPSTIFYLKADNNRASKI